MEVEGENGIKAKRIKKVENQFTRQDEQTLVRERTHSGVHRKVCVRMRESEIWYIYEVDESYFTLDIW